MEVWRLNRFLASRGLASRRACDDIIRAGRVSVNGATVLSPGTRVSPGKDAVQVDGRPIEAEQKLKYVMLNKPSGVIVTAKDTRGRKHVTELIPASLGRLFPVGRLDANTEGLLLLTNDGSLAFRLTHPRFGVEKTYEVTVAERPGESALKALRRGVVFGEGQTSAPAKITYLGPVGASEASGRHAKPGYAASGSRASGGQGRGEASGKSGGAPKREAAVGGHLIRLTICEGKKRQVRRMCRAVDLAVFSLVRTAFGPLQLGDLAPGSWRALTEGEREALIACAGDKQQSGT